MRGSFVKFLIWLLFALLLSTLQYFGGRIVLPEMGLTPPGWWAWFWLSYIIEMPLLTVWAVAQAEIANSARYW